MTIKWLVLGNVQVCCGKVCFIKVVVLPLSSSRSYEEQPLFLGIEKLRDGATRTSYRYWNGSAYVDRYSYSSYDDSGKVMSTTDANNRTVFYTYDAKGRQLKTIYQAYPEIADESSYTCCELQWTKDSDGRETHYAYDDAGRVTKTWTNISGQSETAPLVSYAYDVFGNKSAVTTYSNASTGKGDFHL